MPNIAVLVSPVRTPVGRILWDRTVGAAISTGVVQPVRPCPVAEEIKSASEPLFKTQLQRVIGRIARGLEESDIGNIRQRSKIRTACRDITRAGRGLVYRQ